MHYRGGVDMVRFFALFLLLVLVTGASASTVYEKDSVWYPGASGYFTLGENITLTDVVLSGSSFDSTLNITVGEDVNVTLGYFNNTFLEITTASPTAINVCKLTSGLVYKVTQEGVDTYSNLVTSLGCLSFSTISSSVAVLQPYEDIITTPKQYYLRNDTGYFLTQNATFPFYCFPKQNNCYPQWQTGATSLIHYNNNMGSYVDVYIKLNQTTTGYTMKLSPSNSTTGTITLTNDFTLIENLPPNTQRNYWVFIDTNYPYEDMDFQLLMEVV
jgi:hypothetical protein